MKVGFMPSIALTTSDPAWVVVAVSLLPGSLFLLLPGDGRHDVDDGRRLLQVERPHATANRPQRQRRRNAAKEWDF